MSALLLCDLELVFGCKFDGLHSVVAIPRFMVIILLLNSCQNWN